MSESSEWRGTRKDVRSVGNRVAEVGLEYFCPDYVSKNGVSVTERNTRAILPSLRTLSTGSRVDLKVAALISLKRAHEMLAEKSSPLGSK